MTSKVFLAIRVPADPVRAFEAFTADIAAWWRPDGLFRITPRGDGRLAFEAGVGGRLYTTLDDGSEFEIGRISAWEPGRRLVLAWRDASFAPDQSTEVEVPARATLARAADWWRASLAAYRDAVAVQPSSGRATRR